METRREVDSDADMYLPLMAKCIGRPPKSLE